MSQWNFHILNKMYVLLGLSFHHSSLAVVQNKNTSPVGPYKVMY